MLQIYSNEWEEVYKSKYSKEIYSQNRKYTGNTGDFYVREVYFANLGNSGVIILNSADIKSLISSNTFEKSSRDGDGGSIYINQGQSSIRKVCSFGSKSTGWGTFSYISVPDVSTKINEFYDSSITFGNQKNKIGYCTLLLYNGNSSFAQNNVTRNYCQINTAFRIGSGQGSSSIKFSIIDENFADCRICWTGERPKSSINSFIFINNTVSKADNYPGMIYCDICEVTFENCIITNNKQNNQYLFGIMDPSIVSISNSFIDATKLLYPSGKKVTIIQSKEVLLELHLLSTGLCPLGNYFVHIEKEYTSTDILHLKGFAVSVASLISEK